MPLEVALVIIAGCVGGIGVVWRWGVKKDRKLEACMEARLGDLRERLADHDATAAAIAEARKANGSADEET